MPDSFIDHPSNDLLERYSLASLSGPDLAYVEEHLLVCESCRQRLAEIDALAIEAWASDVRAARALRDVPLNITHHTGDGPVRLRAQITETGDWHATISGKDVEAARRFATIAEANEYLLEMFRELFPEHECGDECR